jgi:hypothetical protein
MVAGQVIDFDPAASAYVLPRDRAVVLTRSAGPDNLARVAQFIAMLGEVSRRSSVASTTAAACPTATTRASTS